MQMKLGTLLLAVMLTGCSTIKFADGERVAIEHEPGQTKELQAQADKACIDSGGKPPAVLAGDVPVHNAAPAWMLRHIATFRCAK